jgi:sugar lactone lactonase YvrE
VRRGLTVPAEGKNPVKTKYSPLSLVTGLAGLAGGLLLSGCSANFGGSASAPDQVSMQQISGVVHGGQQALNGAQVYLYAVGTGGYGTASTQVAGPATTDALGNFSFNGGFSCTAGQQIYLYSVGGDPEVGPGGTSSGNNPGAGLLAVVGHCTGGTGITNSGGTATGFVFMDEVSTIAAAYSLSAYATDATHIGSSGTALANTNLSNAIDTAFNLVNQSTGAALAAPLNGNGTVPSTEINALADILAACVNTASGSSQCSTLFTDTPNGSGTAPTDTATAAINIAHNPTANVTALLNTVNSSSPFQPVISSATSFTLAVNYTGGGLSQPSAVAVDASGNIWVANQATPGGTQATGRVSKFNPLGVPANSTGYTGGGLILGQNVAVDNSGNVWVSSTTLTASTNNLCEFNSSGTAISPAAGFTGGGLNNPIGLAIDQSGNVWTANDGTFVTGVFEASKFNSSGVAISPADGYPDDIANGQSVAIAADGDAWVAGGNGTGNKVGRLVGSTGALVTAYTGAGQDVPVAVAIDSNSHVWIANDGNNTLSEFNAAVAPVVAVSPTTGFTGGGLNDPTGVAIDGAGNVWTSDYNSNALSEFNSSGTAISPSGGFTGGSLHNPDVLAIDGAGNIWIPNIVGNSLTEFVGAATPVVTPLVANLTTGTKVPAQKP